MSLKTQLPQGMTDLPVGFDPERVRVAGAGLIDSGGDTDYSKVSNSKWN